MNQSVSTLTGKTKIKIVFLGNQSVGKSSVIEQYIHNRFQQTAHPTVGIDFLAKNIIHKNKTFRLQLWDTAGQQRFRSLIPSYLKDSQCALILYDVTNKESFTAVQEWLRLYNENKTGGITLLVGNKIDLTRDRQVTVEEAMKKASSLGMFYFQISAKTGQNIDTLFINLVQICSSPSIDPQKFNFQKHAEPDKIDEVQQKNEEEKQKQTNQSPQPNFSKSKQNKITIEKPQKSPVQQNEQTPTKKVQNKVTQKTEATQNKVIRLQDKKQKPKVKSKNCC